ncbi:intradiol ring-cleavage dioxygenase [Belliella pelovolcani]|uniref:Hydroxyquinol 1,2-dioxygenase n=1 Tax=Belliella pelovolcani TaxID=529505 RepID=A0A1N7NE98_9BACT|nr:intradiol ring-cleavage dioxygenase [Belliella pelovolcani]SIS96697.1 hydroxyquinol 1,2-dioxygenase [Belliella pelovolcani]
MKKLTEKNLTESVLSQIKTNDARKEKIYKSFIKHLHDFVRDVEPTQEEWAQAISFLTATGQISDDKRQEFILLSDILGVSILVDAINHRAQEEVTESTVQGPFWRDDADVMELGANIAQGDAFDKGEPTVVRGKVLDSDGNPVVGAIVETWQSDADGFYDLQHEDVDKNLRAVFKTAADGSFWFRTIKPCAYPIPDDGPVGKFLRDMGRHPMRPAHLHFMIKAKGFRTLVTHLFLEGDEYLESDTVFAVKDSLIVPFSASNDKNEAASLGFEVPFYKANYDFVLKKEK